MLNSKNALLLPRMHDSANIVIESLTTKQKAHKAKKLAEAKELQQKNMHYIMIMLLSIYQITLIGIKL